MKVWNWLLPATALGIIACSAAPEPATDSGETGELTLSLVGSDTDGTQYRLRDAVFQIYGYPDYFDYGAPDAGAGGAEGSSGYYSTSVSSETDPDAASIRTRLVPGYYYSSLNGNQWYLERLTAQGPVRVQSAVLLSPRTQFAYVWNGSTVRITYSFGVDGSLIDFRSGNLDIEIRIERPGDGAGGAAGEGSQPEPAGAGGWY